VTKGDVRRVKWLPKIALHNAESNAKHEAHHTTCFMTLRQNRLTLARKVRALHCAMLTATSRRRRAGAFLWRRGAMYRPGVDRHPCEHSASP